jgi:hypothetical protein
VNLRGFLYVTQRSVKQMLKQSRGGSVVSITASTVVDPIAGGLGSVPMMTKGGIEAIYPQLSDSSTRKNTFASTPSRPALWTLPCIRTNRRIS